MLLIFSSCTTYKGFTPYHHVNVRLDAYGSNENIATKKVALMISNDESIQKHDLKNMEFEGYIKKVLAPKGYTFTDNKEDANIVIFYEYGVSDPRYYTSEKIVPVWGVTGISSSVTTTIKQRTPISGRPYTQQYTYNTPSYGKIGERAVTETTIKYLCWANISAYDADYYRKTGEDKMLWLTEIQSENETDNLRFVFPYMIAAAKYNMGLNRTDRVFYNIPSSPVDKEIMEIKNTLVTIRFNEATKGKNPQATVEHDVYRNNELIIRTGTPVRMEFKKSKASSLSILQRTPILELYNFSTNSIYGRNISLKGRYQFQGEITKAYNAGILMVCLPGPNVLFPVWIPLLCAGKKQVKIPAGTYLWLEME